MSSDKSGLSVSLRMEASDNWWQLCWQTYGVMTCLRETAGVVSRSPGGRYSTVSNGGLALLQRSLHSLPQTSWICQKQGVGERPTIARTEIGGGFTERR